MSLVAIQIRMHESCARYSPISGLITVITVADDVRCAGAVQFDVRHRDASFSQFCMNILNYIIYSLKGKPRVGSKY